MIVELEFTIIGAFAANIVEFSAWMKVNKHDILVAS